MRLEQLEYLMKVGTYQNMTKAADALHISQPALSESIKRLEKELGRWQKKVRDQRKELERLRQAEEDARQAVLGTGRLLDGILTALALHLGERAEDPDTGEALGWRLTVPGFDLAETEEKYEVRARRDSGGGYVVGVLEK